MSNSEASEPDLLQPICQGVKAPNMEYVLVFTMPAFSFCRFPYDSFMHYGRVSARLFILLMMEIIAACERFGRYRGSSRDVLQVEAAACRFHGKALDVSSGRILPQSLLLLLHFSASFYPLYLTQSPATPFRGMISHSRRGRQQRTVGSIQCGMYAAMGNGRGISRLTW